MRAALVGCAIFIAALLQGCMSVSVVEQSSVIDDRPLLSFSGSVTTLKDAVIYVDNLYAGELSSYLENQNKALKLTAGTHLISVTQNGEVVYREKIFLLEGTAKTIRVSKQ